MKAERIQNILVLSLEIIAGLLAAAVLSIVFIPVGDSAVNLQQVARAEQKPTPEEKKTSEENTKEKREKPTKLIALTFDDGPTPTITNRILETLERYDAKATFFVVGRQIEHDRGLTERAVQIGCQIGNHTWEHRPFFKYSKAQMHKTLKKTIQAVKDKTGADVSVVRPTYGEVNEKTKKKVAYPMIYWNVDTEDWDNKDAKKIFKKIQGKVKDGDIVLMHDLYKSTADALEKIIPYLQKEGFQLVTIDELMKAKGIKLKSGKVYYSAR